MPFSEPFAQPIENLAEALRRDGAIVTIEIQIPSSLAGQSDQIPPAQVVKGMVDTGASISTVSDQVAAAAGLQAVGSVQLFGVGGGGERPIYAASFGLPEYGVTVDPIEVGGVDIPMHGIDILIGRDILKALNLSYRGPEGAFELTEGAASPAAAGKPEELPLGSWVAIGGIGVGVVAAGLVALKVI